MEPSVLNMKLSISLSRREGVWAAVAEELGLVVHGDSEGEMQDRMTEAINTLISVFKNDLPKLRQYLDYQGVSSWLSYPESLPSSLLGAYRTTRVIEIPLEDFLPKGGHSTMETDRFVEAYDALTAREVAKKDAKRNDYTGPHDPFFTYRKSGEAMGVSTGLSMLGRMVEKMTRLQNLLRGTERQVLDETIEETTIDIAIISKLIAIWWSEQSKNVAIEENNAT